MDFRAWIFVLIAAAVIVIVIAELRSRMATAGQPAKRRRRSGVTADSSYSGIYAGLGGYSGVHGGGSDGGHCGGGGFDGGGFGGGGGDGGGGGSC